MFYCGYNAQFTIANLKVILWALCNKHLLYGKFTSRATTFAFPLDTPTGLKNRIS